MAGANMSPVSISPRPTSILQSPSSQEPLAKLAAASSILPSPVSATASELHSLRLSKPRRERPCDACRRRKTRCVIPEGVQICTFCRSHARDCTFIEKPQPRRKRRLTAPTEEAGDRRSSTGSSGTSSAGASGAEAGDGSSSGASSAASADLAPGAARRVSLGGGIDVVRSVESDDSLESLVDAHLVMRRISPQQFASLAETYFQVVWPYYPIVAKEDVLGSLHSDAAGTGQLLLAAICIVTLQTSLMTTEQLTTSDWQALLQYAEFELRKSASRPDVKSMKAALLLLNQPESQLRTASQLLLRDHRSRAKIQKIIRANSKAPMPDNATLSASEAFGTWSRLLQGTSSPQSPVGTSDTENAALFNMIKIESTEQTDVEADCLMRYLGLTEIANVLIKSFPEQKGLVAQEPVRQILQQAKPIQIQLKRWFLELPPDLSMDAAHPALASATASLYLAYYAAEISLHRQIIAALQRSPDLHLEEICRPAARTRLISAMDFLNRLRPRHFQGFWFSLVPQCFSQIARFGVLLAKTAGTPSEAAFFAGMLSELRWTLHADAKFAPYLEDVLESELSYRILADLAGGA